MNAKALSIMRYQDDINTEHNMKSICHAAVAQWTKRLTRNGQTRVRIGEAHIFDITFVYGNSVQYCIIRFVVEIFISSLVNWENNFLKLNMTLKCLLLDYSFSIRVTKIMKYEYIFIRSMVVQKAHFETYL